MRFSALVPMLQTHDMAGTIAWYEQTLRFKCVAAMDDDWCRLERDDVAIMFMCNDHLGPSHATATQYIYVDDVLGLWETIKHRCTAEWGPDEMPYGMQVLLGRGDQLRRKQIELSELLNGLDDEGAPPLEQRRKQLLEAFRRIRSIDTEVGRKQSAIANSRTTDATRTVYGGMLSRAYASFFLQEGLG